jgi:uncharacterized protein (DUF1330 family)
MPAYWVARSKINDPVDYKKYTDLVPEIIAKYGGKVLARGGRYEIMEGPDKFHRFIVIEFPTFEQGVACFRSNEYDEAAAFRRSGAGEVETIMVEGFNRAPLAAAKPSSAGLRNSIRIGKTTRSNGRNENAR